MDSTQMDRERKLIEDVQRELPNWGRACNCKNDFVTLNQDAFAPALQ